MQRCRRVPAAPAGLSLCKGQELCKGLGRWSIDRGDVLLDRRSAQTFDPALLERDHLKAAPDHIEKLARLQQEIRVARLAEGFVAVGEGVVEQHTARGQRRQQVGGRAGDGGS